jgi:hypothetical protein
LAIDGGYVRSLRLVVFPVLLAILEIGLKAQKSTVPRLEDFVGTYADTPSHPVEIVNGDKFFAVQDEAKYHLIPKGVNAFSTMYGPKLSFQRDANGTVTGYEQNGKFHPRVSSAVTSESAALAWPRTKGQEPSNYRYKPPVDMHDGIAVGDIARSLLGPVTANAIVRAILDGITRMCTAYFCTRMESSYWRSTSTATTRNVHINCGLQPSLLSAHLRESRSIDVPSPESTNE